MVNNINTGDILTNNAIQQKELLGIERKSNATNPYAKSADLIDQTDISSEAIELYERDKEIQKYKNLVLENFDSSESTKIISNLINSGKYQISDDELANSLLGDEGFVDLLVS